MSVQLEKTQSTIKVSNGWNKTVEVVHTGYASAVKRKWNHVQRKAKQGVHSFFSQRRMGAEKVSDFFSRYILKETNYDWLYDLLQCIPRYLLKVHW